MTTVKTLIETVTAQFEKSGIPQARWDAELIIAHGLRKSRLALYADPDIQVDDKDLSLLQDLIYRRAGREPLQYLIGTWEFWGRSFKVNPHVLIPRPETEFVIQSALSFRYICNNPVAPIVVDIGTGSGCLAVTLAKEFPDARIYATDLNVRALKIAKENAETHRASNRIQFLEGDLYEPLIRENLRGRVNMLVSNPPYIPRSELMALEPEIRKHEPWSALDGGMDGLSYYHRLLKEARTMLAPGGIMILEVGKGQMDSVLDLAIRSELCLDHILQDYAGIPRVLALIFSHRSTGNLPSMIGQTSVSGNLKNHLGFRAHAR